MTKKALTSARTGAELPVGKALPASGSPAWRTIYPHLNGGEAHGRYRIHGKRRRRDRRSANAAPAGGADTVCRYDAALRGLGWIVAGLRHSVSGTRSELCGLSRGGKARGHRL